jgi:transcriptional regulator with XRE-family HTH domain
MQALSNSERMNLSNAKALRRSREFLKVTRNELAALLGLTAKSVEKYENGRVELDEGKINKVLRALDLTWEEFKKIKKGKKLGSRKKNLKTVFENADRRSYRKIMTKEVKVLKALRKMGKWSQDQASSLCGYSRPTIGHIENGRIELPLERIQYIVTAYGFKMQNFDSLMKEEVLRDEITEECMNRILHLPEEKLKLVQSVLANL